jgi:hypothetical protein
MQGLNGTDGVTVEATTATTVEAPLGATAPASSVSAAAADTVEASDFVQVPQSAFKKLKDDALERGRKKAQAEFEERVKAAGFSSFDDLLKAVPSKTTAKKQEVSFDEDDVDDVPVQVSAEPPKKTGNAAVDRERERLYREKLKLQAKLEREALRRRELQRELDAREAEMGLRQSAALAGVRDIDYAITLLERHISGKDESALADFDERAYFNQLRSSHPYLFGETVVAATTGNAAAAAPKAPAPNAVTQQTVSAQSVDARKMNREEYTALLRSRGLSVGTH